MTNLITEFVSNQLSEMSNIIHNDNQLPGHARWLFLYARSDNCTITVQSHTQKTNGAFEGACIGFILVDL